MNGQPELGQPEMRSMHEVIAVPSPVNWVEDYGDYLYRFALVRLGTAEAAEDLVQETFLAALRSRENFQGASSERTWLVSILKHKMLDYLRRKHREQPLTDLGEDEFENSLFDQKGHWKKRPRNWNDPGASLENAEFWEVFSRCLSKLPGRLAETFTLRELDGLPGREVCEALQLTSTNLAVMLHRARLRLWRCLGTNWFGCEEKRS
jgi:RNA polymerase sigma-70 factor (ECF subfamily)